MKLTPMPSDPRSGLMTNEPLPSLSTVPTCGLCDAPIPTSADVMVNS